MTTYHPGDHLHTPVDVAADATAATKSQAWRRWPTVRLEAVLNHILDRPVDDSTDLYDAISEEISEEIDEREHDADVRRLNGGVLP